MAPNKWIKELVTKTCAANHSRITTFLREQRTSYLAASTMLKLPKIPIVKSSTCALETRVDRTRQAWHRESIMMECSRVVRRVALLALDLMEGATICKQTHFRRETSQLDGPKTKWLINISAVSRRASTQPPRAIWTSKDKDHGRAISLRQVNSRGQQASEQIGTRPWMTTGCCREGTPRKGQQFQTSTATASQIRIGWINRIWIRRETTTSGTCHAERISWSRIRATSSRWRVRNRKLSKIKITRCSTETAMAPKAETCRRSRIWYRGGRKWPGQVASTSQLVLQIWILSRREAWPARASIRRRWTTCMVTWAKIK